MADDTAPTTADGQKGEPAPEAQPEAETAPAVEAQPQAEAAPAPDAQPQAETAPAPDAQPQAEGAPAEAQAQAEAGPAAQGQPQAEGHAPAAPAGEQKPKRSRKPRNRGPRPPRRDSGGAGRGGSPRERGPLPFDELRAAATTSVSLFGGRQALKDAFGVLGDKERKDLSRLVADDADWRKRARAIAAGSLGAGRVGKALAAQQISMAQIEELWSLTLSKEEADTRLARIRDAKRRDEQRAQRQRDRENSSERVSRADLKKAQDGRVGAQIRIVIGGVEQGGKPRREERDKEPGPEKKSPNVLDRLGY
ncbi:MAG: hypothetical protein M3P44_01110 [Actinomycetota bacterium]|nr:hypothetical protein [Actinomycetota bacterium]